MRAILIDPEVPSMSEIEITGGDIHEIRKLIGCDSFTTGSQPLRGDLADGFDGLLVSDDYIEEREENRFWFQVDADQDPPSSYPIAGKGLVTGVDKMGETCSAEISLQDMIDRITFSQRTFRGFVVREGRGEVDIGGMKTHELMRV